MRNCFMGVLLLFRRKHKVVSVRHLGRADAFAYITGVRVAVFLPGSKLRSVAPDPNCDNTWRQRPLPRGSASEASV